MAYRPACACRTMERATCTASSGADMPEMAFVSGGLKRFSYSNWGVSYRMDKQLKRGCYSASFRRAGLPKTPLPQIWKHHRPYNQTPQETLLRRRC